MQHNCDIIDLFPNYRVHSSKHLTKNQTLYSFIDLTVTYDRVLRLNNNCFEPIFYLLHNSKMIKKSRLREAKHKKFRFIV